MPSPSLLLLVAPQESRVVSSLFSDQSLTMPPRTHGETVPVSVVKVEKISNPKSPRSGSQARLWNPVAIDVTTAVKVAFGKAFQLPQAGSFPLTWEGDDTTALTYQPTALQVENALNALASVIAAGGVVVTEPDDAAGNFFLVTWVENGPRTSISGDATGLAPLSVIDVGTLIEGIADPDGRAEVQTIRIVQNPAAFVVLPDMLPDVEFTPTSLQVGGGGNNARWRIELYDPENPFSSPPYDGYFSIKVTVGIGTQVESALIAIDSTEDEIIAILEAMSNIGAGDVQVLAEQNFSWILSFKGALADTAIDVDGTADSLKVLPGKSGSLSLATPGIELILGGRETVEAILEVDATPDGEPREIWVQAKAALNDALIDPSSTSPTPAELYYTQAQVDALIEGTRSYTDFDFDGEVIDETSFGYFVPDVDCEIIGTFAVVGDAPTGANLIVDLTVGGAEQAKLSTITAATVEANTTFGSPLAVTAGQIVRGKVKQVGSTFAGEYLTLTLKIKPAL